MLNALIASFAAGLGTTVGGLAILTTRSLSVRAENMLLSAAAGVMLAASCFSLLQPALALGVEVLGGPVPGVLVVIAGLMAGGYGLHLLHERIPHEHFHAGHEGPAAGKAGRVAAVLPRKSTPDASGQCSRQPRFEGPPVRTAGGRLRPRA